MLERSSCIGCGTYGEANGWDGSAEAEGAPQRWCVYVRLVLSVLVFVAAKCSVCELALLCVGRRLEGDLPDALSWYMHHVT